MTGSTTPFDLSQSESRLRAVLETAVDAIIMIDGRGIVQSFNPAAETMFGFTADEVIGQNIKMLMPSPYREEHDGYIEKYRQTGERKVIGIGREVLGRRRDGTSFPVELAVSEIPDLGLFTGIIRDLSDRKEAEDRLRQADRLSSIGTLAAGLGHDMNNVLLPIRARLDLIEQSDLPAETREQVAEIRKAAGYLQDLADGLHLLALDPDDAEASKETTTIDAWWQQTHTLLARALPKLVEFSATLPDDLPAIRIAPHRLTQAVLNMLVNSARAVGERGRVHLWAEAVPVSQTVRLGITDDGCGMTPEVKRRALEPFFTTGTRGLGTGLGLSLVHGVMLAAGGTVEIDSSPGVGSTVVLSFPAAPRRDAPIVEDAPRPRAAASIRDRRDASIVTNLLEFAGFELMREDERGSPDLWVLDAADRAGACAESGSAVIVVGQPPDGPHPDGVRFVGDVKRDFQELRAAINDAAEGVQS